MVSCFLEKSMLRLLFECALRKGVIYKGLSCFLEKYLRRLLFGESRISRGGICLGCGPRRTFARRRRHISNTLLVFFFFCLRQTAICFFFKKFLLINNCLCIQESKLHRIPLHQLKYHLQDMSPCP
jgi:hypothetical protein